MSEHYLNQSILSDDDRKINDPPKTHGQLKFDNLSTIKIYAYGVGHFFNDLLGAIWFNFLFYYLKRVVKTQAATFALVVGQICDGIMTPVVGVLSDKFVSKKWGQRTPWYFFGTIVTFLNFIPIWQGFQSQSNWDYAYYAIFPGLVNIGWAMVQISHMSLAPALTCSRKRRDKLNNLRNSFSFVANFTVLALGLLIFELMNEPILQYRILSYIIAAFGLSSSAFFLWNIKQIQMTNYCLNASQNLKKTIQQRKNQAHIASSQSTLSSRVIEQQSSNQKLQEKQESFIAWFKLPKFYLFGICYMGVRLYTNMFGTFLPFYLEGVLKLGIDLENQHSVDDRVPFSVALVPLIAYLSSALVSSFLNKFYQKVGRKKALLVGSIIACACSVSIYFISEDTNYLMYLISFFVGISQTMVLATGINFISDVVGTKSKSGAFVFGCYSLFDKFSAGLTIYLVGNSSAYSKQPYDLNQQQKQFIKYTFILIPALACILASVIVILYPVNEYTKKEQDKSQRKSSLEEQLVF